MITFDSSHSSPGLFGISSTVRGLAIVAGMALLLAGCGKGQPPASSAPVNQPKASSSAPASAAPAELPGAAPSAAASVANAQAAAQAKAKLSSMSVPDLLSAARQAYAQHRLVAPAGDNAMEYYEAVLAKDPSNQVAKDALRETFPFGVPDVEKAISQNNFPEANREIDVLAKADPTNYTLTLLRSKLDAQQKLQARQQQEAQQKTQKAQEQAAAAKTAAAKAAADREAAAKLAAQQAAAPKPTVTSRHTSAPAAEAPKPTTGITRDAKVIAAAAPSYPIEAARNQTSGFAVVQFTISPTGAVVNPHVIQSSPRRVFDNAAVEAVRESKFEPAMKDGQPVSATLQRRIDFKFGG